MLAIYLAVPSRDTIARWSMTTAYGGLALLGATLMIGPLNVLRLARNPVSTDLRRDLGICGALISLIHVVIGLQAHFRGHMLQYFFYPPTERHSLGGLRGDLFGFANYTGLIATGLVALLLALSNDLSLRRLGGRRWKSIQRWNYALFALVVIHGVVYQVLEQRTLPYPVLFGVMVAGVVVIQFAGFRQQRQRSSNVPPERPARRHVETDAGRRL
jgi:sulfoxide reductase heme-binding subunit YedZ